MWTEWLKDEIQLIGDNESKVSEVITLLERALKDYHYRKVYKIYLKLLIKFKIKAKADVFERALRIWGLDY